MHNGINVVSARDLHLFLEVKTDFSEWCKRMFEYGFIEGQDYSLLKIGERSAHNKIDFALALNCAKEISMLQRSDKGKQARLYFIECERIIQERQSVSTTLPKTKEQLWQMALTSLNEEVENQKKQLELANSTIMLQAPKVQYVNEVLQSTNTHTTTTIAKELGMSAKTLNRLLKERGIQYYHQSHWVLTSKYQALGYCKTKTHTFTDTEGRPRTEILTVWTELGRAFIHKLFNHNLGANSTHNPQLSI